MNLDRIAKLIRLSASQNDNEAQAAFAKAKQLADEAGIDLAIVEAQLGKEQTKEEFIKGEVNLGKRESIVQKFVNWLLPKHFNVNLANSKSRYAGGTLYILGRKSDVEFATFANEYLNEEFMRRWHYFKAANNAPLNSRNAYIYGMYKGLDEKLAESKKEQEAAKTQQLTPEVQQSFALVLVNEKSQRQQFEAQVFPRLRTVSSKPLKGLWNRNNVISAGHANGRLINVNRPLTN